MTRLPSWMRAVLKGVGILLAGAALFILFPGKHALGRWALGGGPGARSVYMKLPLEQPQFHWYFRDEAAFLEGSLEIEIHGAHGRDTVLTVFSQGEMAPGWRPISRDERGIYFGVIGGGGVWTEPRDSLVVRLRVARDLAGVGAYRKGVLPKGQYEAVASYMNLIGVGGVSSLGKSKAPTAFVGCWRTRWPLEVTSEKGWLGPVAEEERVFPAGWRGWVLRRLAGRYGTDGFPCVE